jgi:hypothetical protein
MHFCVERRFETKAEGEQFHPKRNGYPTGSLNSSFVVLRFGSNLEEYRILPQRNRFRMRFFSVTPGFSGKGIQFLRDGWKGAADARKWLRML